MRVVLNNLSFPVSFSSERYPLCSQLIANDCIPEFGMWPSISRFRLGAVCTDRDPFPFF